MTASRCGTFSPVSRRSGSRSSRINPVPSTPAPRPRSWRFNSTAAWSTTESLGPDTWRALVEAGYRLGDRLLYARVPMMRGDDVAELQRRLDALGFPIGKVDGIFGGDTLAGLLEFQASRRLPGRRNRRLRGGGRAGLDGAGHRQAGAGKGCASANGCTALPGHLAGQRRLCRSGLRKRGGDGGLVRDRPGVFQNFLDLGAAPVISAGIDTAPPARVRAVRANRLGWTSSCPSSSRFRSSRCCTSRRSTARARPGTPWQNGSGPG